LPEVIQSIQETVLDAVRRKLAVKAQHLGSPDCESAAQEAVLRALENPLAERAFRFYYAASGTALQLMPEWSVGRLEAWLFVTVRFVVSEQRRKMAAPGNGALDPAAPGPDALDSLLASERKDKFNRCLACLKPNERRALLLYHDGRKYSDIAREMGTSENSVASWIKRGRERLLQCVRRTVFRRNDIREEGDPDAGPGRRAG
jgi:RNA polymerase sigma factor (sigma-70 family)